jgi:hypothetical protein
MRGIGESTDSPSLFSTPSTAPVCSARRAPPPKDQGGAPMSAELSCAQARAMSRYLLEHRHQPQECGGVFAAFNGHASPLRRRPTLASCRSGGHAIWWTAEATSEAEALALLPRYVAERTYVALVSEVHIP